MNDDDDPELLRRIREQAIAIVRGIPRRRAELAEDERAHVHSARKAGVTWNEIARLVGMSAGWMAKEKYGEPKPGGETDGT